MAGLIAAIGFVGVLSGLPYHSLPWLAGFAVAMCLVGLLDDIVDLRPRNKLILELAAICILGGWGPQLDILPYQPLNIALTIFWLITATNAFNLIDGIDGLAAGVGIVAALSIATVAGLHQHEGTMLVGLALAGALAGFMVFNFPPASIFMGDEGALAVGDALELKVDHAARSAIRAAVGRRSPSPRRPSRAPTTARRVRAERARRPSRRASCGIRGETYYINSAITSGNWKKREPDREARAGSA